MLARKLMGAAGGDGTNITAGSFTTYDNSSSVTYNTVTALSSTKALVCYVDGGNSNYGTACVLDVSGASVTAGTAAVFESASTDSDMSVCTLSSTKALVCYRDAGTTPIGLGTACVLDVSGSTITPATPVVYSAGSSTYYNDVTMLSSTKALVVFTDTTSTARAAILDVSGSTITAGTVATITAGSMWQYLRVVTLSSTKAFLIMSTNGGGAYLYGCVLDVSGSTITPGTVTTLASESSIFCDCVALTSTQVLAFNRYGQSAPYIGKARLITISGSSCSAVSAFTFYDSNISSRITSAKISDTKALVTYQDASDKGHAVVVKLSGTTISKGTTYTFNDGTTNNIDVAILSSTQAICAFRNRSTIDYGQACTLNLS